MQLRTWQVEALDDYQHCLEAGRRSCLWEATPGAGKTTAALQVVQHQLSTLKRRQAIVVVPTAHLKIQWATAAARFNIHLDSRFRPQDGLGRDYDGFVVTYQQLANNPAAYRTYSRQAIIVLDEVHHAAEGLMWGDGLLTAFDLAPFVLCLSGTPFRSDNSAIPFVTYEDHESQPDYVYGYGRAIADQVCRPVAFFTYGGEIAWEEGSEVIEASFADEINSTTAARRLRAALDPHSEWIQTMLRDAHQMLQETRSEHPEAGGLLVAVDQEHARHLAHVLLQVSGSRPTIVLSDDSDASQKIKQFAVNRDQWLVACNMVSEGVDIPRLRVGVYATTVTTRMYFRQFLGRMVRVTPEPTDLQIAYTYLPADPRLRRLAEQIEEEQAHVLKRRPDRSELPPGEKRAPRSEWNTLRAINSGVDAVIVNGQQLALWSDPAFSPQPQQVRRQVKEHVAEQVRTMTKTEQKAQLSREIKKLAGLLHQQKGIPYSQIHGQLNRQQQVRSQRQCTVEQLEERLRLLEKMLSK